MFGFAWEPLYYHPIQFVHSFLLNRGLVPKARSTHMCERSPACSSRAAGLSVSPGQSAGCWLIESSEVSRQGAERQGSPSAALAELRCWERFARCHRSDHKMAAVLAALRVPISTNAAPVPSCPGAEPSAAVPGPSGGRGRGVPHALEKKVF